MPRIIARFLKLPNPELYTGHCFRRSSVTQLANSGGDLTTIKRHGGWKSSTVAEGYIDTSESRRVAVAEMLSSHSSTSSSNVYVSSSEANVEQNIIGQNLPEIKINAQDSSNVTIKVYNNCTIYHQNS